MTNGSILDQSLKMRGISPFNVLDSSMKHTITATFIAPVLGLKESAPINLHGEYYINTYSADALSSKYSN